MLIASSTLVSHAQERDRSKVPDEYKWDLTAIYPSDQAWRAAKEKLASELPNIRQFQGTLASSASRLAEALETENHFDKEFTRLYVYASMNSDQDTRVSTYQGMQQEMIQFGATLGTETAFAGRKAVFGFRPVALYHSAFIFDPIFFRNGRCDPSASLAMNGSGVRWEPGSTSSPPPYSSVLSWR